MLINNAGVIEGERRESEDGYELTFAVNYLAHFLLTRLLVPLLRDSAPARVVNVASVGQSPIDFDDVMLERGYDPMRAYTQSKLAQVMFTFELAERLRGSGVTVNALHPASLMDTRMVRETFGRSMSTVEEGRRRPCAWPSPGAGGGHGPLLRRDPRGAREPAGLRRGGQEEVVDPERGAQRAAARTAARRGWLTGEIVFC